MDGMKHSAPARSRREMRERLNDAGQSRPEGAFPAVVTAFRFHRPINQKGPAHDGVTIDESPVAAVEAAIAIVAHRKVFSRRYDDFISAHVLPHFMRPFRLHGRGDQLAARRGKGGGRKQRA